jgi:hypothetical protein
MLVILGPVFEQARLTAIAKVYAEDAKLVSQALVLYEQDHKGKLPDLSSPESAKSDLSPYLTTPGFAKFAEVLEWNADLSLKSRASIPSPEKTWVFHTSNPDFHQKFDVGFVDGHADLVSEDQLTSILAAAKG